MRETIYVSHISSVTNMFFLCHLDPVKLGDADIQWGVLYFFFFSSFCFMLLVWLSDSLD